VRIIGFKILLFPIIDSLGNPLKIYKPYFSATSTHTCIGDGNAMVASGGISLEVCFSLLVAFQY